MGVVDETIEDCIGQGWVSDCFVPVLDRHLAGDNCGCATVAVFEDFQQVTALRGGQDGEAPIVDDQHIHAGDGFEDAFMAAIATGKSEGFEHARGALIKDGPPVTASLMAQGAGDPAFARTGGGTNFRIVTKDFAPSCFRSASGRFRNAKSAPWGALQIFDIT